MILSSIQNVCEALAEAAGFRGPVRAVAIAGGANNRVYRVETGDGLLLLKSYFRDSRDRLGTEFAFSDFAWRHGVRTLARPVARDSENGVGLYEFIPGRRLGATEIDAVAVGQAVAFYRELNLQKGHPDAANLADGSEACFSIRNHLDCVGLRVRRLEKLEGTTGVDDEAADFVRHSLRPVWEVVASAVLRGDADLERTLGTAERCLSPSDFGYHNALLGPDGIMRFLDFEYAGWDDPAKLVCDFFCQPAVPVPIEHLMGFAEGVVGLSPDPRRDLARILLLLPLYRLKWCCIVLNEFLPEEGERRRFASPADEEVRKVDQLSRARQMLRTVFHPVDFEP